MIKKLFSVTLTIILIFTLCSCGKDNADLGGMANGNASSDTPYIGTWVMVGDADEKVVFEENKKCIWRNVNATHVYDKDAGTITVDIGTNVHTFEFGERYGVECLISKYITLTREKDYPTYRKAYGEEQRDATLEKFNLQDTPQLEIGKEYSPAEGVTFTVQKIWVEAAAPNDMNDKSSIFVEYTVTNQTGEDVKFVISGWNYFFLPTSGNSLWGWEETSLAGGATQTRQVNLFTIAPDPEQIQDTAEFGYLIIYVSVNDVPSTYLITPVPLTANS